MAKRAPDATVMTQTALLPGMLAYDDLEGPSGAWQALVDHAKVRHHLEGGGRVHIALEAGWFRAYPAAPLPPVAIVTSRLVTSSKPGGTVIDAEGIHTIQADGTLGPWTPHWGMPGAEAPC
jgi:hypothetical protein